MSKGNFTIRNSVPIDKLEGYMRRWEDTAKGFVKVYSIGESGGWPILCAEFTDPTVPSDDKEVALITAQHSGMEISAMTTLLSLGNYLAAFQGNAREILKHQIVLIVPCSNCYSYAKQDPAYQFRNEAGVCEYAGAMDESLTLDTEKTPAAAALKALIDKWKPEHIFDAHGIWFNEAILMELTGGFSGSSLNRTFDRDYADDVNRAADSEGYAIMNEDALQTIFPTDPICYKPEFRRRFRIGSPLMLLGNYAYIMYHTFVLNMEVGFEGSGLARIVRSLERGNAGYPGRTMIAPIGMNSILVGGYNARERRESRVEMWPQNSRLGTALIYPETMGLSGVFVARSNAAHQRICGSEFNCPTEQFIANMEAEGIDMSEFRKVIDDHLPVWIQSSNYNVSENGETAEITHGMTIRLGLPYIDAQPTLVWLNGRKLTEGEYSVSRGHSWTNVDVCVPCGESPEATFAFVTYDCTPKKGGIIEF